MSSTKRARLVAGSRQGFARAAVALLLAAMGLALPTVRALHASHDHAHAASAASVDAACPDGCVDPSHHHHGDAACVLCAAHAAPTLPALARLAAPRAAVVAAAGESEGRRSASLDGSFAPRGPPSSLA